MPLTSSPLMPSAHNCEALTSSESKKLQFENFSSALPINKVSNTEKTINKVSNTKKPITGRVGLQLMALLEHMKDINIHINNIDKENEFRSVYGIKNPEYYGVVLPLKEWPQTSQSQMEKRIKDKYSFTPEEIAAKSQACAKKLSKFNNELLTQQALIRQACENMPASPAVVATPDLSEFFQHRHASCLDKLGKNAAATKRRRGPSGKMTPALQKDLEVVLINNSDINISALSRKWGVPPTSLHRYAKQILAKISERLPSAGPGENALAAKQRSSRKNGPPGMMTPLQLEALEKAVRNNRALSATAQAREWGLPRTSVRNHIKRILTKISIEEGEGNAASVKQRRGPPIGIITQAQLETLEAKIAEHSATAEPGENAAATKRRRGRPGKMSSAQQKMLKTAVKSKSALGISAMTRLWKLPVNTVRMHVKKIRTEMAMMAGRSSPSVRMEREAMVRSNLTLNASALARKLKLSEGTVYKIVRKIRGEIAGYPSVAQGNAADALSGDTTAQHLPPSRHHVIPEEKRTDALTPEGIDWWEATASPDVTTLSGLSSELVVETGSADQPAHAALMALADFIAKPGNWNTDNADVMPYALVESAVWPGNHILVISRPGSSPLQIIPRAFPSDAEPVYVPVRYDGCGHYDAINSSGCTVPIARDGDCFMNAVMSSMMETSAGLSESDRINHTITTRRAMAQALCDNPAHYLPFIRADDVHGSELVGH